jgi:hypothetical protein
LAALRLKSPINSGAHQDRAAEAQQEIDDALLVWLEYARAGDAYIDPCRLHPFHRRAQPVEFQIIKRDAGRAHGERGVKLLGRADEEVEIGRLRG